MPQQSSKQPIDIAAFNHPEERRINIPTAEYEAVMAEEEKRSRPARYQRNRDLDPQLVWRGKDEQDRTDLTVAAPPLYIQEKVHPKALIDDLRRRSAERTTSFDQLNLFADFDGLADPSHATEFYQHEANWSNRLILGDSLQVMASLAEREGLRGKVQCIYIDPPYGIKFNSNFQWSTTSRDVKDGNREHITREPEQVKAFRDTWRDGIHSYLTYLRDRLTVARDLLTDSGSIFVQIGDENVHRVRALMDEVFGEENFCRVITIRKTAGDTTEILTSQADYILWAAKDKLKVKYRSLFLEKEVGIGAGDQYDKKLFLKDRSVKRLTSEERLRPGLIDREWVIYRTADLRRQGFSNTATINLDFEGRLFHPGTTRQWKTPISGLQRLKKSDRLELVGNTLEYRRYFDDWQVTDLTNIWLDAGGSGFGDQKIYVVQTIVRVIQRCILMTTDPGDLVLDPTCGSGTTAYVAEQWARRWITIDTSRVALALARARIMGARYPYYLLADSKAGQQKEAELTRTAPSTAPTYGSIRHGFVCERVPHITLKSIANNAEIDVIWEKYQELLEPLRASLNAALAKTWEEWEIPREAETSWPKEAQQLHAQWWGARIARQREIDASIAAKADSEYLYDKPYEDKSTVRVAGPFTVESLSPHRVLAIDENDELITGETAPDDAAEGYDFTQVILENLKTSGVQQAHKEDRITFTSLEGWPGHYICAEARYNETDTGKERRAGVFIGPEFGTVPRADLVAAAREAGEAGFDVVVACAFNYDARAAEFDRLGRIPILKARMNADLHMADTLKNTGAGNLFVIFGEPDIAIKPAASNQVQVQLRGVDVFRPQSGEVTSSDPDEIACWFIDTDYNEESFFVRHAYFLGANDPYKALKTTLKAEIDEEAWETLHSSTSRPFDKPKSGRIAVKVINHLGDEVMKVFSISGK